MKITKKNIAVIMACVFAVIAIIEGIVIINNNSHHPSTPLTNKAKSEGYKVKEDAIVVGSDRDDDMGYTIDYITTDGVGSEIIDSIAYGDEKMAKECYEAEKDALINTGLKGVVKNLKETKDAYYCETDDFYYLGGIKGNTVLKSCVAISVDEEFNGKNLKDVKKTFKDLGVELPVK